MKLLKNIYPLFLLLGVFTACESDLDKANYAPDNASFTISSEVAQEYVLDPQKSADTLIRFEWNKPEVGYDASIIYNLEADVAGKNFSGKQILSSSNEPQKALTTGELNSALSKLIKNYKLPEGEAQVFEFRITASISDAVSPLYSNIVTSKITPFSGDISYPKVWVIGDYCGWDHNATQFLYDFTGNDEYEAWIFFNGKAANGFKFSGAANWDNGNWGLDANASAPGNESASLLLVNDGGSKDIKCYAKNYYKFSFNKNTLELKKIFSMNSLGVVGAVNDWGNAGADIPLEFDPVKQRFSAVITLAAAGEIKFRADNTWGDVEFGGSDGILTVKGANIAVAAGTYNVTLDLNNSNEMTYKLEGATALDPSLISAPVLNSHNALEISKTGKDPISWNAVDFGGQEAVNVNYVLEMDLAGSNFANAQQLASTKGTSVEISGEQYLTALTALGKASDEACNVEIRVKATVTGVQNPYISNVVAYSLTVNTGAELPTNIYINGSFNDGWNWASTNIKQMIPVNSHPGIFWGIYYFDANAEIKFSPVKDWAGDFGSADQNAHGYGSVAVGGNNLKIANAGFYQIVITCTLSADGKSVEKQIELFEPKVYLMGDGAPDKWNTSATNAFTLQGDIYVSPAQTADNAIRMCIKLDGCEWWQTEFNVYDGKIVYRGTGGDQAAVQGTAGQIVKLNFKDNTGVIE